MKLLLINCDDDYAVCEMINAYLPKQKIERIEKKEENVIDEQLLIVEVKNDNEYTYLAELYLNGQHKKYSCTSQIYNKTYVKKAVSECFRILDIQLPWGLITGIRPAKIVRQLYEQWHDYDKIYEYIQNFYNTNPSKAKLCVEVAKTEQPFIDKLYQKGEKSIGIYVGIPFCPTRCLYCSFTSQSIKFSNKLVEPYVNALLKEIQYVSDYLKTTDKIIETVYIGGGTPTALNEKNLEILLKSITEKFDLSHIMEFTVEAGRPDTINEEKLKILKKYGVDRISINPQTMNEETLKIIGRCHTAKDICDTYMLAKKIGFEHINMDLIAGLPGETEDDFNYTLEKIKELNPSSVTVHTMCIKHGSYLDKDYSMYTKTSAQTVDNMLNSADKLMRELHKHPYYLYRQKNMLGNLENVGYCNDGNECLYNIFIMEEVQSIIALGSGGSTKLVKGTKIDRVYNVKEVIDYVTRIDEMIERKQKLFKVYGL